MNIAIVGSGISGLTSALLLSPKHKITVFESESWIGGHAHTVPVVEANQTLWIDTGFIVCNPLNYPNFMQLMQYLQVELQKTSMSFSVKVPEINLEYNGTSFNGLFAQRKNLVNPKFWLMLKDILKFNKAAKKLAQQQFSDLTLDAFVTSLKLGSDCYYYYILPMSAAIWSTAICAVKEMPAIFLCRFFDNHGMLNIEDRPQWYSVVGGSHVYVKRIKKLLADSIHANTRVLKISRNPEGVKITTNDGEHSFDKVIIATHSDQSLSLLSDPSLQEQKILSAIKYAENEVVLHTDKKMLPVSKRAWASWNYVLHKSQTELPGVTYNMNILQNLDSDKIYCLSLNQTDQIDAAAIIDKYNYCHPQFDIPAIQAQQKFYDISGVNNTYYCGAYWGSGFHEDGVNSALRVIAQIDKDLIWKPLSIPA